MVSPCSNQTPNVTEVPNQTGASESPDPSDAQQHNIAAFRTLWERYHHTLFLGCSLRLMQHHLEDAQDALSGANLRALHYLSTHTQKITNLKAWFIRILYHHCMDTKKENQKHRQPVSTVVRQEITRTLQTEQPLLEDQLLRAEMRQYVRSCLDALPTHLREPSILYFMQAIPQRDIAMALNISHDNVRKRLQLTRTLLRKQVVPYFQGTHTPARAVSRSDVSAKALCDSVQNSITQTRRHQTSPAQVMTTHTVSITRLDGIEKHVLIALHQKPHRAHQKCDTLRAYVQRHPWGWRKRMQLADLLYGTGQWNEAIVTYQQVLQRQPKHLDAYLRWADMLRETGRVDEAVSVYQDALAITSDQAMRYCLEGYIAAGHRKWETAIQRLSTATVLAPRQARYWRTLGQTQLQAGRPVEALKAFNGALQIDPNDLIALTESYAPLMVMGQDWEAQRRMKRVLERDSDHVLALTRLANHASRSRSVGGDASLQPQALIKRAMRVNANHPAVHASLAYHEMVQGNWREGIMLLKAYTHQHVSCPAGWLYYAYGCRRTGDLTEAVAAMTQARALDPNDPMIAQLAIDLLAVAKQPKAVSTHVQAILKRLTDHWNIWIAAGRLLVQYSPDKAEACRLSTQATRLQPHLPRAWFYHGCVLALAGQFSASIAALEKVWQQLQEQQANTLTAPTALWLGKTYGASGNHTQSQIWYKMVIEYSELLSDLDPAMAHYWKGKAYTAMHQQTKAQQAYRRALQHHLLHPAHVEAKHAVRSYGMTEWE